MLRIFIRKEDKKSAVERIVASTVYNDDPVRFMALAYVKGFVVENFLPFSLFDGELPAEWAQVLVHENEDLKAALVARMGSKNVSTAIQDTSTFLVLL